MAKKPKKNVVEMDDTQVSFLGKAKVADVVTGNDLDNQINGRGGNDKLKGMGGNDTLIGGRGNDKLDGGEGDDNMSGGAGDDIITANAGTDTVDGGDGDDTLKIAVNYADATVNTDGESFTITTALGTVTVKNVEFFQFNDKTVTADNLIPPSSDIILTEKADNVTGAAIFAPRGFTPGGTDQVNTLNDDDIITGTGDNATLTVDFVNDADTGDNNIQPTISNLANIITNVRTDADATIDLQDSEGIADPLSTTGGKMFKNLEVQGIDDFNDFTYDNIQHRVETLTVRDSNAPNGDVHFLFDEDAVEGDNDATTLVLDDAEIDDLDIDPESGAPGKGIEHLTIQVDSDSSVNVLSVEDAEDIIAKGPGDLTLGEEEAYTFNDRIEASIYTAGLANVAGTLTSFDAKDLTGNLEINLGSEVQGTLEDSSGDAVEFKATGGAGDDIFRLLAKFDSKGDIVDGGAGSNTLVVYDDVDSGTATNIQHLEVRNQPGTSGASPITVDTSLIGGLVDILVRNEGVLGPNDSTIVLNKLTAAQATAITVLHSTTGSNGLDDNTIAANLATDTANDTVGIKIMDGMNSEPRFNFELNADSGALPANRVENISIDDKDSESNSVFLTNFAEHTGTLTVVGEGKAGTFLNFDAGATNLYNKDVSGGDADSIDLEDGGDAASGAVRTVFSKIDAASFAGDLIVRVGVTDIDITTGSGNDTIIFDANDLHSGLSIADKVNLGAGNDTVAIDGFFAATVNVGASEWTNFKGVDNIRLVDNDASGYFITLTNELVDQTDGGTVINIINDLDPDNNGNIHGDDESDATIDARSLIAGNFFTFDGAESGPTNAASTADETFILADASVNGGNKIDGGYDGFNTNNANDDEIQIRNAAVVTIGDLVGISNIGTLNFVNDLAAIQNSVLELDTATIDRMVNSSHDASTTSREELTVRAEGNAVLPAATSNVNIDLTNVDFTKTGVILETGVGGFFTITGATGPVTFNGGAGDDIFTGTAANDTINGGGGADTLTGGDGNDVINGGGGADIINAGNGDDDITGGAGNDTMTGGAGFDDFFFAGGSGGLTPAAADHITDFQFNVDKIQSNFNQAFGDVYQEADGSAMTFANITANADALFTGGLANIYVAFNAVASGNAYVLIDQNFSGSFDAGDTFVILDGIATAAQISSTDFA